MARLRRPVERATLHRHAVREDPGLVLQAQRESCHAGEPRRVYAARDDHPVQGHGARGSLHPAQLPAREVEPDDLGVEPHLRAEPARLADETLRHGHGVEVSVYA